jgi:uncharacterized membrane protein
LAKRNRNRLQQRPQATPGAQVVTQQISYSGPLPASGELQNYENVLTGLANRIVAQFEVEGNHRRSMESRYLDTQRVGLFIGSALYLVWLPASFVMIMTGHSVEGAVSGVLAIGALTTNTVIGYRRRNK